MHSQRIPLSRMYDYRRMLPHHQKANRALFITFCKLIPPPLTNEARDIVMHCCMKGNHTKFHLHGVVVMPDHVHLMLTPLQDENDWTIGLPAILKLIKGASARGVNKLLGTCGRVWQEESFDQCFDRKKAWKKNWNTSARTPSAAAWFRNLKTIAGSGASSFRPSTMVLCQVTAVWVITGHVGSPQTVWVGHSCPTRVSRNNPG